MGADAGGRDPLAAVRAAYAERLRLQAREIRHALDRASAGEREAVEEVRRIAHRLHGTAGSFGFDDVSSAAAEVEELAAQGSSHTHLQAAGGRLVELMGSVS